MNSLAIIYVSMLERNDKESDSHVQGQRFNFLPLQIRQLRLITWV